MTLGDKVVVIKQAYKEIPIGSKGRIVKKYCGVLTVKLQDGSTAGFFASDLRKEA